jgi:hypothetical protein
MGALEALGPKFHHGTQSNLRSALLSTRVLGHSTSTLISTTHHRTKGTTSTSAQTCQQAISFLPSYQADSLVSARISTTFCTPPSRLSKRSRISSTCLNSIVRWTAMLPTATSFKERRKPSTIFEGRSQRSSSKQLSALRSLCS